MLKNYLKIAVRNLLRYKVYSFLNISGLSVGLASFTLIMLFVWNELSYDRHFTKSDKIFRIYSEINTTNGKQVTAQTPPGWARYLSTDYPEIMNVVRIKPPNQWWKVVYEKRVFYEKGWAFVDSTAIDVFDINLKKGDPSNVLSEPYQVILSERMADKYFGKDEPVGKSFRLDNAYDFTVTGVYEKLPSNTHFDFDFLASFITLRDPIYGVDILEIDNFPTIYTYVEFREECNEEEFNTKLNGLIDTHIGSREELAAAGFEISAKIQPITDIHLRSHLENEIQPNANIGTIYIFSAIALFILLIAAINFMNLSTARSIRRAQEVGLRKVSGASKKQLVGQFLGESVLIAMVSLLFSIVIVALALPVFSDLVEKKINTSLLTSFSGLSMLLGITIMIGLISGIYPAFYMSSFKPADVLKGNTGTIRSESGFLRKILIVFQFAISLGLIISTGILYQQMKYIRDLDLGLDEEQVIVVQLTDPILRANYRSFKNRVKQIPSVVNVSASFNAPADIVNQAAFRHVNAAPDEIWMTQFFGVDFDFFETLGLELVAGRGLSHENAADTLDGVILNETAAREFGWETPRGAIGEQIIGGNPNAQPLRIIGVVRDFHMQSVHERITPMVIMYWNVQSYFYSFIKINSDLQETLQAVEHAWADVMLNYPFQFSFLDDDFEQLYKSEETLGRLLTYFAILTIFIACLGLYGLASYMVEQRTKEIGIRKVLGASIGKLIFSFTNQYSSLILIAFVFAAPIAYKLMDLWLQTFEYRITIPLFVFGVSLFFALVIAVLTVSFQSLKAATSNPVNSLRAE